MKLKNVSLIVGAIALSLTATIPAVNAQTTSSSLVAQAPPQKGQFEQRLGLTDTQKSQIASIRRNTRAEMEKILTAEQREQIQTAMQNRQRGGKRAFSSLNLTEEQKTRMREIKQSEKQQIEALLTDEQKQQWQKIREEKRARRQQRNPG